VAWGAGEATGTQGEDETVTQERDVAASVGHVGDAAAGADVRDAVACAAKARGEDAAGGAARARVGDACAAKTRVGDAGGAADVCSMSMKGTVGTGDGASVPAGGHGGDSAAGAAKEREGDAAAGAVNVHVGDVVGAANGRSMPMEGTECAWRGWHRPWNASRS